MGRTEHRNTNIEEEDEGELVIDMSMNNVIILFEPSGNAVNEYLITIQIQDAIRFPTFTLLGQLQKPGLVAEDKSRIDKTHKAVNDNGSTFVNIEKPIEKPRVQQLLTTRLRATGKPKGDIKIPLQAPAPRKQKPVGGM